MIKFLNSYSIKKKFNLIVLFVSSITLLIASTIFLLYDRSEFKSSMQNELSILGKIIGDRSAAALLFNDYYRVASEVLTSLKVKKTITRAFIYTLDGSLFAEYYREPKGDQGSLSHEVFADFYSEYRKYLDKQKVQFSFNEEYLDIWVPIVQDSDEVGFVYIESDLSELEHRFQYFIQSVVIIYFISLFFALLMSMRLQKIISGPLSNLINLSCMISKEKDYSLRANIDSDDELGKLNEQFNEMLDTIQSRDLALQKANMHLEKRVKERTSELTSSNQQLIKAKEYAINASKSKSQFLANMSHEIRTPMNGVISASELMSSEQLNKKSRQYLTMINSSASLLLEIIDEVLDFSKIEAGKLEIVNAAFYLNEIFTHISDIFLNKFQEKKVDLLFDIDPRINNYLYGDSLRIQQVLVNMIANGLKFTEGEGCVICGIKLNDSDSEHVSLTFYVKDNGIGIESSKVNMLFNAFTQADSSTTRKYGGTGLGLAICKSLVELMGGTIGVQSEAGKGSYFYFDVNLGVMDVKNKIKQPISDNLERKNIIIIDDNEDSLLITKTLLESFNFDIEAYDFNFTLSDSGKGAINELKNRDKNYFDLILLDWKMPIIDGLKTAKIIRKELGIETPIVLMSAYYVNEMEKAVQNGIVNAFLQKPILQSALFDTFMQINHNIKYPDTIDKKPIISSDLVFSSQLYGNTILVAEDNVINQEVVLAVFETMNVAVQVVNNGKEILEALKQRSFDLILMDMQMPVMDGYEATKRIRAISAYDKIPVIALTAHAMVGDKEKCLSVGCDSYLKKPINKKQLFKVLSRFLKPKVLPENIFVNNQESITNLSALRLDDDVELLDLIPEINIYEAIKELHIKQPRFKKILFSFYVNNLNKISSLSELFKNNEWQELQNEAHTIKGSSVNIGAYNLEKKSYNLELICKEPIDLLRVKTSFNEFINVLEQVLESINIYVIATNDKALNDEDIKTSINAPIDELKQTIDILKDALEAAKPAEIKKAMTTLAEQLEHPLLNTLNTQINAFDFDEGIETLVLILTDLAPNITQE